MRALIGLGAKAVSGLWLCLLLNPTGQASTPERRSGFLDMSPQNQALQRNRDQSPALLERLSGLAQWRADCATCHGEIETLSASVSRFPRLAQGSVQRLSDQINLCRVTRVKREPWGGSHPELLSLQLALQQAADGRPWMPISPADGAPAAELLERGRQLFNTRMGQLNLSCAQCHDGLAGQRLGSAVIPQGHPNGYPLYRLEWQAVGSLERRIRNCNTGVRAEPLDSDGADMKALVGYLAHRARGMPLEGMAIRP